MKPMPDVSKSLAWIAMIQKTGGEVLYLVCKYLGFRYFSLKMELSLLHIR